MLLVNQVLVPFQGLIVPILTAASGTPWSEFEILILIWTTKLGVTLWLIVAFVGVQELRHIFLVAVCSSSARSSKPRHHSSSDPWNIFALVFELF